MSKGGYFQFLLNLFNSRLFIYEAETIIENLISSYLLNIQANETCLTYHRQDGLN
jgi:hypothetical protein